MNNVFTLNNFRTSKTKVHPVSLATVNKYNANYPGDKRRHHAAFKIANEFPNLPLGTKELVSRMKKLHFY